MTSRFFGATPPSSLPSTSSSSTPPISVSSSTPPPTHAATVFTRNPTPFLSTYSSLLSLWNAAMKQIPSTPTHLIPCAFSTLSANFHDKLQEPLEVLFPLPNENDQYVSLSNGKVKGKKDKLPDKAKKENEKGGILKTLFKGIGMGVANSVSVPLPPPSSPSSPLNLDEEKECSPSPSPSLFNSNSPMVIGTPSPTPSPNSNIMAIDDGYTNTITHKSTSSSSSPSPSSFDCEICCTSYSTSLPTPSSPSPLFVPSCSSHRTHCLSCASLYISEKVATQEVYPALLCMNTDCQKPLHWLDILNVNLSPIQWIELALWGYRKVLLQSGRFIQCAKEKEKEKGKEKEKEKEKESDTKEKGEKGSKKNKEKGKKKSDDDESKEAESFSSSPSKILSSSSSSSSSPSPPTLGSYGCLYGFLITKGDPPSVVVGKKCDQCHLTQPKLVVAIDDTLKELIKSGVLRQCPNCSNPQGKDYGICNVIQCGACQIWWNWETKQMGNSQSQVKEQARMNGTLWGAGELQFQMRLERTNKEEFIKLLERNGVEYNPHYHRGS